MAKRQKFTVMTAGKRLEELRKRNGLSMNKLASMTSLSPNQIASYENDQYLPNANALIKLSENLKTSIDYILTGKNYPFLSAIDSLPEGDFDTFLRVVSILNRAS